MRGRSPPPQNLWMLEEPINHCCLTWFQYFNILAKDGSTHRKVHRIHRTCIYMKVHHAFNIPCSHFWHKLWQTPTCHDPLILRHCINPSLPRTTMNSSEFYHEQQCTFKEGVHTAITDETKIHGSLKHKELMLVK